MKKIVFSVMIVACLLTLGVGNAAAANGDYHTLVDWINTKWNIISLVDPDSPFTRDPIVLTANVEVKGQYADGVGVPEDDLKDWSVGWYLAGDSTVTADERTPILSDLSPLKKSDSFKPGSKSFGIYLTDGTNYYYSQAMCNGGTQYAKTYQVQPAGDRRVIIGFDVNLADNSDPNGYQYVDVVVDVQPVASTAIPEFPSIALPVAAIIGIMFIIGRKKE